MKAEKERKLRQRKRNESFAYLITHGSLIQCICMFNYASTHPIPSDYLSKFHHVFEYKNEWTCMCFSEFNLINCC